MRTHRTITVWPKKNAPSLQQFDGVRPCVVCDLYIADIERVATLEPWGWRNGNLENIDHHAPHAAFQTDVTSTELAILRTSDANAIPRDAAVIINHTDCDSILSSGIVSGRLQPLDLYRAAALAADHTGAEDTIADTLQGMDDASLGLSAIDRLELAFQSLDALEAGRPLPPLAQMILDARRGARAQAYEVMRAGRFHNIGGVWWAELPKKIDGELFIPFLPDAEIVVLGFPGEQGSGRSTIKARLGMAKRPGLSLQSIGIDRFDANWGGRWDAGSNTRVADGVAPGTALAVEEWANRAHGGVMETRA